MGTDGANLITWSLSVDKLVDLLATTVDDMTAQLYFKSLKYIFNESKKKKKSWPWHMYYDDRFCWQLSVCLTRFIGITANAAYNQPLSMKKCV